MPLFFLDLSGLTLQSGPSRLVKDEYSAGAVGSSAVPSAASAGMEVDSEQMVVQQTIQHHAQHATSPHHHHQSYGLHMQPAQGFTIENLNVFVYF